MTIVAVAVKELMLYFTSFLFYALATVFLVLAGYLFYTNLDFYVRFGGMNLVLRTLAVPVPRHARSSCSCWCRSSRCGSSPRSGDWARSSCSGPTRSATSRSSPGSSSPASCVLATMLAADAGLPAAARPLPAGRSWGPLFAGYLGLLLLAAAFVACGLFLSALTDSQLVAGASTYGVLLFFWMLTWNEAAVSEGRSPFADAVLALRPLPGRSRGGIDTRDVAFLVLFTATFLAFTLLRARHAALAGAAVTWPGRTAQGWARLAVEAALLVAGLRPPADRSPSARTGASISRRRMRSRCREPTRKVLKEVTRRCASPCSTGVASAKRSTASCERLHSENPHDRVRPATTSIAIPSAPARSASRSTAGRRSSTRAVVSSRPRSPRSARRAASCEAVRGRRRRAAFTTGHGERTPDGRLAAWGVWSAGLDAAGLHGRRREPAGRRPAAGDRSGHRRRAAARSSPERAGAARRHLEAGGGILLLLDPGALPHRWTASWRRSVSARRRLPRRPRASAGRDRRPGRRRRAVSSAAIRSRSRSGTRSRPAWCCRRRARSTRTAEVPGVAAESIARTAPTAWAMHDIDRARRGEEPSTAADDVRGPLSVMVLAEVSRTRCRPPAAGSSSSATPTSRATRTSICSATGTSRSTRRRGWAARSALTGARPHEVPEIERPLSPLVLTESQAQRVALRGDGAAAWPVLLTGVVIVALRRRRG